MATDNRTPSNKEKFLEDTRRHISDVQARGETFISILADELSRHDESKLDDFEADIFAEHYDSLFLYEYGTPEYKENMKKLKPAIKHHHTLNPHHPEHYSDGVNGMDLIQLVAMYLDWSSACTRTSGGSLLNSIEVGKTKYAMSDQLVDIFTRTMERYGRFNPEVVE